MQPGDKSGGKIPRVGIAPKLTERKVSDRPGFNKLELFARQQVAGWDVWGNEVRSDINLAA
jgi:N6-adenosine-specific RNA methylase IME4